MKKCYIIKKNKEIKKVLDNGKRYKSKNFIMYITDNIGIVRSNNSNKINISKVAFLVSKKLGNSPQRNKAKRKLRISTRLCWKKINKIVYIVILAKNNILDEKQENLDLELKLLLKKNLILDSK